jgi:HEAT repeat protein
LRAEAVDALVRIGAVESLIALETVQAVGDAALARKVSAGIARIRCRAVDRTYAPTAWPLPDEGRLRRLVGTAVTSPLAEKRAAAAEAVVKLGEPTVAALRDQLANQAHGSTSQGRTFHVTQRAADLLVRIGKPAVPALLDALCDEQDHARAAAANALARTTGLSLDPDYEKWKKALADKAAKPPAKRR